MNISRPVPLLRSAAIILSITTAIAALPHVSRAQQAAACAKPHEMALTRRYGDRVLSTGRDQWTLLDVSARRVIAAGKVLPATARERGSLHGHWMGLAGEVFAVFSPSLSVEIRDARDGQLVREITPPRPDAMEGLGVSTDGSYVWVVGEETTVWSPQGMLMHTLPRVPDPAASAEPDFLGLLSYGGHSRVLSLRDGSVTTPFADSIGMSHRWSDDGTYIWRGFTAEARFFDRTFVLQATFSFPSTAPGDFVLHGSVGPYLWGSLLAEKGVSIFLVKPPGLLPVRVAQIPVADWGLPPRNNMRAHRNLISGAGSLAVFGLDPSYFWLADLRGAEPKLTQVQVPEPLRYRTFSSDAQGRWSAVAESGRIYASDGVLPSPLQAIGCTAE